MNETIEITTEQINDLPVLLGIVEELGSRRLIDAQIQPHGRWQGISRAHAVSIWLCHLLMERDHLSWTISTSVSESSQAGLSVD
jgi:hypothetical protein